MENQGYWVVVVAVGALLVSIWAALARSFDKSLSIREHEEFKGRNTDELKRLSVGIKSRISVKIFDDWRDQFRLDVARIETMLRDMRQELTQKVETAEQTKTADAKHDELKRIIDHMQTQIDNLFMRMNGSGHRE